MALYYYSDNPEYYTDVYHDNENCPEGSKIEANDRKEAGAVPAGRRLCESC